MSDFQKKIEETYKDYTWKKSKLKNDCESKEFKMHKTQEFLSKYFTPEYLGISPTKENIKAIQKDIESNQKIEKIKKASSKSKIDQKGMMLYHSVGSGKTCAAIAMGSNFNEAGYTVLWVTRNSLRQVMYQNIFDQICHPKIKKENLKNERSRMLHFNKITNKRWLKPISYKTFSNLIKKKSQTYRDLVKINNSKRDPLRKTLVIVDEAHNMSSSNPKGLSKLEKPSITNIKKLINDSYKISGNDSVRLLLLTATPGLNGMQGLVNLLNYMTEEEKEKIPDTVDKFSKIYLKKDLTDFNQIGRKKFRDMTKKYVSFLDRTKDYNIFARKEYDDIKVNITNPQRDEFDKCKKLKTKKVDCMKKAIIWNASLRQNTFRFEKQNRFDENELKNASKIVGTKFIKLLEKIKQLDKKDMGKHVIFIDEPKFVKILTSFLIANNFNFVFEPSKRQRGRNEVNTLSLKEIKSNKKNNFAIFTKGTIYNRNVSRKLVSKVNKIYNERPGNIKGDKLRFIIIDKNYLEGVSFFDTKYFHILTEPKSKFEMEQLVGRVVRTCGHKGLPFKKGWKINIYIYNSFQDRINYDKLIKEAIEESLSKDEAKRIKIQDLIISEIKDNAFDKLLTKAIH